MTRCQARPRPPGPCCAWPACTLPEHLSPAERKHLARSATLPLLHGPGRSEVKTLSARTSTCPARLRGCENPGIMHSKHLKVLHHPRSDGEEVRNPCCCESSAPDQRPGVKVQMGRMHTGSSQGSLQRPPKPAAMSPPHRKSQPEVHRAVVLEVRHLPRRGRGHEAIHSSSYSLLSTS